MALRLGKESKIALDSNRCVHTLHRLYDGDRQGGWVEDLDNIKNGSWVADEAEVYGDAIIDNGSIVAGRARVFDEAIVAGDAWGNAIVEGEAVVCEKGRVVCARVDGCAKVCGNALTFHGCVSGNACIKDNAVVCGHGFILCDGAVVSGNAYVCESIVAGNCQISGNAKVDRAYVCGDAVITEEAQVRGTIFFKSDLQVVNVVIKDVAVIDGDACVGAIPKEVVLNKGVVVGGNAHISSGDIIQDSIMGLPDTEREWNVAFSAAVDRTEDFYSANSESIEPI